MKKILVTGGAGYVGTSLIPQLLAEGHKVRVIDNLMFGGDQLINFMRNKNFEFMKGDIRNKMQLKEALKGRDAIVHLAAIVGFPACRMNPKLAKEVNYEGTKNIADLASKNQLITFASTGSCYGAVMDICTEKTPLNPLSLYGQTKVLAENYLLKKHDPVILRFATAFGLSPRLRLDLMINDFTYKALTQQYLVVYEKNFMRTFIHVHDMGRAFLMSINKAAKMAGEVYNVGSASLNFSKEDICNKIKKHVDCFVHYADVGEDQDKRDYEVSYKKIKKLGFDTTITVDEGIREMIPAFHIINAKLPYGNV